MKKAVALSGGRLLTEAYGQGVSVLNRRHARQVALALALGAALAVPGVAEAQTVTGGASPATMINNVCSFILGPFVQSARATFWIEWVRIPGGRRAGPHPHQDDPAHQIEPYYGEETYLRLQYSQSVILVFNKVLWPHITVATLTLSAG